MAKITITIEDRTDGTVKVEATPNLETMFKMEQSGEKMTGAHGYAFCALNAIHKAGKSNKPLKLWTPPKFQ